MKISRRRCVICRAVLEKSELLRLVVKDGQLQLDRKQRLPGRGVYVHNSAECFNRLASSLTILGRALRTKINAEQLLSVRFEKFKQAGTGNIG